MKYDNVNSAYSAEIDFNNLRNGSDMWVFSRIIDKNIDNIVVILTPNAHSNVWYAKDKSQRKITFYSDSASEVSYRLSAPRFDHNEWPALRKDQIVKGFEVL